MKTNWRYYEVSEQLFRVGPTGSDQLWFKGAWGESMRNGWATWTLKMWLKTLPEQELTPAQARRQFPEAFPKAKPKRTDPAIALIIAHDKQMAKAGLQHKPKPVGVEAKFWSLMQKNYGGLQFNSTEWNAWLGKHDVYEPTRLAAIRAAVKAYERSGAK